MTIAERARHELANNDRLTQMNQVADHGLELRVQTSNPEFNSRVEAAWKVWAAEVKFARKVRTIIKAEMQVDSHT